MKDTINGHRENMENATGWVTKKVAIMVKIQWLRDALHNED
jgi:hypothetical protein